MCEWGRKDIEDSENNITYFIGPHQCETNIPNRSDKHDIEIHSELTLTSLTPLAKGVSRKIRSLIYCIPESLSQDSASKPLYIKNLFRSPGWSQRELLTMKRLRDPVDKVQKVQKGFTPRILPNGFMPSF
ncbi:hypothetical protein BpHYR1_018330 [Brachionus plicatilis]|uniref:Uncharacterized protein n=1 Tax=Brachionus plicatilis TaxID=10195 RepID=A0A3M7PKR2_BRAPC|nr:hypothetical protein BpHYR1_018330 [Brachionus plicatilis]